ncbi:MAG: Glu/Leu/Phe/Val dehydrogenase [Oscillospiraceae bacterium]
MPETIIKINLDKYCLDGEAILVIDTVEKTAPAKGGIRVHQRVSEEEITSLAGEMTQKCILAGLPFGGAKGGIRLSDLEQVERAMYAFGRELSKLDFLPYKWCAAPDVNTNCKAVDAFIAGCASVKGWRKSRIAATGKSSGIPHELGSTAYGIVLSTELLIKNLGLPLAIDGAGVIIEGMGEVGGNAAKILLEKGARILGVSDITGAVYNPAGLAGDTLTEVIDKKIPLSEAAELFPGAAYDLSSPSLLQKKADILVLAGPGRSITADNVNKLQVKVITEGANIAYADRALRKIVQDKGIYSIPGIIANSGGVISSHEEWLLENEDLMALPMEEKWERVKNSIEQRITRNMTELCHKIKANLDKTTHENALEMAAERQLIMRNANRGLREQTKQINDELEKRFSVYTR